MPTIKDISRQSQTVPTEHPNTRDHLRMIAREVNQSVIHRSLYPVDVPATVSATYTMLDSDRQILAKAGAALTVNLLTAAGRESRELVIQKIDSSSNIVTIDANGTETIGGATTQFLGSQHGTLAIFSDGTNWRISSLLERGTYTPTLTNAANVAASTAYTCQFLRIGDMVTVSGKVDVDPTSAATLTRLQLSLPFASNFADDGDCGGAAFASGVAGQGAAMRADVTLNVAEMIWIAGDVSNQPMYFSFTYQIL